MTAARRRPAPAVGRESTFRMTKDWSGSSTHRSATRSMVFVWMPALSFQVPDKAGQESLYVQEYKHSRLGRTNSWYTRMSPLAPGSLEISRQIFRDLAAHVQFDGLLFQDDAYLTDEEDMHPAALARFRAQLPKCRLREE